MLFIDIIDFLKFFKKYLKFVLDKRQNSIIFFSYYMLLPVNVEFIVKKQNYKIDAFSAYDINHLKMVLILSIKVIIFNM